MRMHCKNIAKHVQSVRCNSQVPCHHPARLHRLSLIQRNNHSKSLSSGLEAIRSVHCPSAMQDAVIEKDEERKAVDWAPQGTGINRKPGQKRSIAMHLAYVGTRFRGLQLSRELPLETTVEGVLELALLKAGLIAETNYGDLFKIKWSRSSRTDKGVHSLGTVIGCRIVAVGADEMFDTDHEGLNFASMINDHLPPYVRVLSCSRVNKKFTARRSCNERTYEYYLPTSVLGLKNDGSQDDQDKIRVFREALGRYVGKHPFHNYTARKKQYLATAEEMIARKEAARARRAAASLSPSPAPESNTPDNTPAAEVAAAAAAGPADEAPSSPQSKPSRRSKKDDDVIDEDDDVEDLDEDPTDQIGSDLAGVSLDNGDAAPRRWDQLCHWVHENDSKSTDRVGVRHYRVISEFIAEDPVILVPGGVPCMRLQVTGGSFMLNQIRHMIGAAVAAAHGVLSLDLLQASLSAPARITVPKAPPHTLLLSNCAFPPFRLAGMEDPPVLKYTGEKLTLREGGAAAKKAFWDAQLGPEINRLLEHSEWPSFTAGLSRYHWDEAGQKEVLSEHKKWRDAREVYLARRAERDAERAAQEQQQQQQLQGQEQQEEVASE